MGRVNSDEQQHHHPETKAQARYTRAFSTLGCGELSLEEVFALADRHAIPAVEIRALAGQVDLPAYFEATYGTPAALAERLGDARRRIVALDTSFRLLDGTEADREKLLAHVRWAEALGARWLRVFDGGTVLDGAAVQRAAARLESWQALRRERGWGVDWMIETHDVLLDSARIETLAGAVPAGGLHLLWDAHHTWHKGGEDPLATWRAIGRQVVHVHVKDSRRDPAGGNRSAAPNYTAPGEGDFPMKDLRAVLAREFSGVVSLESERFWQPGLPPLEVFLRAAERTAWW